MKTVRILSVALLAWPLTMQAARAQGPVSGSITDARTGTALPGATILLDGTTTAASVTAADGSFTLPTVPAGTHELRITYVGYQPLIRQVQGQNAPQRLDFTLQSASVLTTDAIVTATRANEKTGTTYTNVSREEIEERNFGQDIPYLLNQTPSVVVTSDAGAGVGYTGIRIRGTDIAGINVTINGVPLNDAESHGAFFVNLPDLASSVQDVQVQRGVGTSTNGAAAFGASLNIRTLTTNTEPYAETQNTYGSYNTWRNNVSFGSGLLGGKFSFDGRLSRIATDGYIDRAESDLKSYYFAAGYQQKNTLLKFITFSGREKTYQAWNGVPEELLEANRRYNEFTYDNQTDNYQQNHYQLHVAQGLGDNFNVGGALHLTRGFGYYEELRDADRLSNYGIAPVVLGDTTIVRTDLIRRKWLDNYFYGLTYAVNYQPQSNDRLTATLGGGWNRYLGDHYGEVIWARFASDSDIRQRYYFNDAAKSDFNTFLKATYQATERLGLFGDVQVRRIGYEIDGLDDDQRDLTTRADYTFFNPKAGTTFTLTPTQNLYASFAVGHREPTRSDFTDRPETDRRAQAERLHNLEAGYRFHKSAGKLFNRGANLRAEVNYFLMDYRNQLVPTGQLNDVGTPLRTNIPSSYRTGVELTGAAALADKVSISTSLTLSRNRLRDFREVVYIYDEDYNELGTEAIQYSAADIAYSPAVVSASQLEVQPLKGLRAAFFYKTVSKQYLDNTASEERQIKGYQVADLRLRYTLRPTWAKEIEFGLLINNLFNREYVANGYTFGNLTTEGNRLSFNYYYPQATRNFLASVGLKF